MNFLSLLDRLIPENIRAANDLTLLTRARVLVAFSLMNLSSTVFIALAITVANLLGVITLWSGVASSTVSVCLYSTQMFYFYRTGNIRWATHFFLAILTAATVTFVTITSGWQSPVIIILMCVSTCAFLMQGRKTGVMWSAIISLVYIVFFVIYKKGIVLPQVVESSLLYLLMLFSWIYAWFILFGGVLLYNGMTSQLSNTLNREREQLRRKATYDSISGAYKREAFIRHLRERTGDSLQPGKAFLMLDIEIIAKGILAREDEVGIQKKIHQTIEKTFPNRTFIARSNGLSFLAMIDQVNNDAVAGKVLALMSEVLDRSLAAGLVDITMGAVMVPGYSNEVDEIMVTARRAIQEAQKSGEKHVIYSQSRRIRVEKWTPKNWIHARFVDLTGQATH